MKEKVLPVGLCLLSFAVGAWTAYVFVDRVPPPSARTVAAPDPSEEDALREKVAALQERNAELGKRLRELEDRLRPAEPERPEGEPEQAAADAEDRPPEPPREGGFRARMERMKRENPEGYEEMVNRFAEFRRARAEQANTKLGFLSSLDTTRMSPEAKAAHVRLQEVIVAQEEVEKKLHDPDLEDEDRRALMGEMMKNGSEMMELNRMERDTLIRDMGEQIGFDEAGVADFESAMHEILDATDLGFGVMGAPRNLRGRHGRHGGRGGDGPRGGGR